MNKWIHVTLASKQVTAYSRSFARVLPSLLLAQHLPRNARADQRSMTARTNNEKAVRSLNCCSQCRSACSQTFTPAYTDIFRLPRYFAGQRNGSSTEKQPQEQLLWCNNRRNGIPSPKKTITWAHGWARTISVIYGAASPAAGNGSCDFICVCRCGSHCCRRYLLLRRRRLRLVGAKVNCSDSFGCCVIDRGRKTSFCKETSLPSERRGAYKIIRNYDGPSRALIH